VLSLERSPVVGGNRSSAVAGPTGEVVRGTSDNYVREVELHSDSRYVVGATEFLRISTAVTSLAHPTLGGRTSDFRAHYRARARSRPTKPKAHGLAIRSRTVAFQAGP
jgi:hypothetical protein